MSSKTRTTSNKLKKTKISKWSIAVVVLVFICTGTLVVYMSFATSHLVTGALVWRNGNQTIKSTGVVTPAPFYQDTPGYPRVCFRLESFGGRNNTPFFRYEVIRADNGQLIEKNVQPIHFVNKCVYRRDGVEYNRRYKIRIKPTSSYGLMQVNYSVAGY